MWKFDAEKETRRCVSWIREWFEENGPGCKAVLGISGGKDSSVAAALCEKALGKERVIGILMPNGEQADIDMSHLLCKHLGIENYTINIERMVKEAESLVSDAFTNKLLDEITALVRNEDWHFTDVAAYIREQTRISDQTRINIPPRVRMVMLYAVSQSLNGRVSCNGNLSENYVGYSTRWGDACGDFAPLANFTVQEVKAIGRVLGLPDVLVDKVPADGLTGKTDEDNYGFSYEVLDRYIRTGEIDDPEIKANIERRHLANMFKQRPIAAYMPDIYSGIDD